MFLNICRYPIADEVHVGEVEMLGLLFCVENFVFLTPSQVSEPVQAYYEVEAHRIERQRMRNPSWLARTGNSVQQHISEGCPVGALHSCVPCFGVAAE